MMYTEFLNLAKVTDDDISLDTYQNIIEPMYMATNLSKIDFIKMLNIKAIKDMYPNVNKVCKDLVKLIAEMKKLLGHTTMHEQENKFVELAKQFCELRGMEYCYEDGIIYEIPLYERGCTMYTGFVAKMGKAYYTYTIDKKVGLKKYIAQRKNNRKRPTAEKQKGLSFDRPYIFVFTDTMKVKKGRRLVRSSVMLKRTAALL